MAESIGKEAAVNNGFNIVWTSPETFCTSELSKVILEEIESIQLCKTT